MSACDGQNYARRNFMVSPEACMVLEDLHVATGKSYSELVCLGLLSLVGNHRLIRHTLAQPLSAIQVSAVLLARKHPDDKAIHEAIRAAFKDVEAVLSPPQLTPAKPSPS